MKIDEKVKRHYALKAVKIRFEAIYKAKIGPLNDEIAKIEGELLQFLNETGQESAKTKYGTPYKSTLTSLKIEDYEAFINYVKESGRDSLLERRINKSEWKDCLAEGVEVPGIAVSQITKLNVRKS